MASQPQSRCPVDHRKSAHEMPAERGVSATAFADVRAVLRDDAARQAGFKADLVERFGGLARPPVLYLHGDAHRRQRAGTARFFAPKVVATRYRAVMEETSDRLVARLEADGAADLDTLSLEMAVTVAADIVGLTESDIAGMSRRLDALFDSANGTGEGRLAELAGFAVSQWRLMQFHARDVRPAIAARRQQPGDDVISHLLAQGYSAREILTECVTYGAAGMVTTREFITMAAWHMLERRDLADDFLAADDARRLAILEEILRLEPVIGRLHRRIGPRAMALDIRAANMDEQAVGACPTSIDPDRARAAKVGGAGLAFGDGAHRCPGAGVAMHEASVFLARLLAVPGIRLDRAPDVRWNRLAEGYELRGCRVSAG